ncbi:MAG TPA: cation diffusion facilitator family transporter [Longimicrobiales bacterium]|nr:cation diffusion facilitator family transporter [Longimicrobiales bacterium]
MTLPHVHLQPDRGAHAHASGLLHRGAERRRLSWVLGITAAFMVAEVVGGLLSGSLALLADAGHMLTDAGALAFALLAMRMAQRPPDAARTFGWVRLEVLSALVNGAALLVLAGLVVAEAWDRLREPVPVDAPLMLAVAAMGLGVNVAGAFLLHAHAAENLNVRGAYLHVLGDLLGSVGALTAGLVVLFTGWAAADPLVSVLIAGLILFSAWRLVREAVEVLLEAAPANLDVVAFVEELRSVEGLDEVHDVHVWTLTSGFVALAGHGIVDDPARQTRILEEIQERARAHGIGHVTFQLEMRPLVQLPPPRVDQSGQPC